MPVSNTEISPNRRLPSPNADEAFSLLSIPQPVTAQLVELAAQAFIGFGASSVIVRSGALGAFVKSASMESGVWIPAFFASDASDRVVDVTGAGNAFLGGLIAGLSLSGGDLVEG